MKCLDFDEANKKSIGVYDPQGVKVGKLVPVGEWILKNPEIIESICLWRQKAMRMFLTQFNSTFERTEGYLKNIAIPHEGRLFFMLHDQNDRLIGHMGISGVDGHSGELDNLMRGVNGGDPRLIYLAEIALLDWCFRNLEIMHSDVRVISYNWLVISLHEDVGYVFVENFPLKKFSKEDITFHEEVSPGDSNVSYSSTKLRLEKSNFYKKANWLT